MPRKGPKTWRVGGGRRFELCATEAIAELRISSRTFYKYVRKLGISPGKRKGYRNKWYTWDQCNMIREAVSPPLVRLLRDGGD